MYSPENSDICLKIRTFYLLLLHFVVQTGIRMTRLETSATGPGVLSLSWRVRKRPLRRGVDPEQYPAGGLWGEGHGDIDGFRVDKIRGFWKWRIPIGLHRFQYFTAQLGWCGGKPICSEFPRHLWSQKLGPKTHLARRRLKGVTYFPLAFRNWFPSHDGSVCMVDIYANKTGVFVDGKWHAIYGIPWRIRHGHGILRFSRAVACRHCQKSTAHLDLRRWSHHAPSMTMKHIYIIIKYIYILYIIYDIYIYIYNIQYI